LKFVGKAGKQTGRSDRSEQKITSRDDVYGCNTIDKDHTERSDGETLSIIGDLSCFEIIVAIIRLCIVGGLVVLIVSIE